MPTELTFFFRIVTVLLRVSAHISRTIPLFRWHSFFVFLQIFSLITSADYVFLGIPSLSLELFCILHHFNLPQPSFGIPTTFLFFYFTYLVIRCLSFCWFVISLSVSYPLPSVLMWNKMIWATSFHWKEKYLEICTSVSYSRLKWC
jgi:hypothetical protein